MEPAFTSKQAAAILDDTSARSAHLVDAVLLGVRTFNEHASAQLFVLFSQVESERVQFALFDEDTRLAMCVYSYNPDSMDGPNLTCIDAAGRETGVSVLSQQLHPLMDFALARMEGQVWQRVTIAS